MPPDSCHGTEIQAKSKRKSNYKNGYQKTASIQTGRITKSKVTAVHVIVKTTRKNVVNKRKKESNTLNGLTNQLDLWRHRINAWLDDPSKEIKKDEITSLAVKILRYLYQRKHITKEDLQKVSSDEPSGSPSRACTHIDELPSFSVQNDPVKQRLNFGNAEDENLRENNAALADETSRYKEELYTLRVENKKLNDQIQCLKKNCAALEDETRSYKEELYAFRVENKKLIDQIQCLNENYAALEDETGRYEEELLAFRVENNKLNDQIQWLRQRKESVNDPMMESTPLTEELCGDDYKIHAKRYRAERDESRLEVTRLNAKLKIICQKGEHLNQLVVLQYKNGKLTEQVKNLTEGVEYLKKRLEIANKDNKGLTAERDAVQKTVEEQAKLLQEIQKRTDDEVKDARDAITQYQNEANRYKIASDEANVKVSLTNMEKEELLTLLQKQKSETHNYKKLKDNLQNVVKEQEAENYSLRNYVQKLTEKVEQTQLSSNSHTHERYRQEQAKQRYQEEIHRANHKVQSLTSTGRELSDRLDEMNNARDHLAKNILKDQLAHVDDQRPGERSLALNYHKELLNKKNEELAALTRKLYSLEEQQNIGSKRLYDIEKENISLKKELSVTLQLLEESKEENRTIEKRYNVGNADYRNRISTMEMERNIEVTKMQGLINELRSELHNTKSTDEQEKSSIQHELSKIKEHNQQLDKDRHILGKEIYSLKEQKLELQKSLQQVKEHVKDQQKLKEEIESLKKASTAANMDRKKIEERCKTETEKRMSLDKVCTELRNENERLQKDRNAVISEVQMITAEKNQLAQKLVIDINAAKKEHEQLKTEKNDLIKVFNEKSRRDKERISMLERECETLTARFKHAEEIRVRNDNTYNNKLIEENDQLRNERNLVRNELDKITKVKDEMLHELKQKVAAAESKYDTLKKEKDDIIINFKESSSRDKNNISKLQQECGELRARFNKETDTRSHKDDTYNKLGEENNRLKSEITELVKVTNGKEEMIDKLKQEVTAAKSEFDKLKKEKDNLMIDANRDKEKIIKLRQECEELFTKYEKETVAQSLMNDINEKLKTENEKLRRNKNAAEAELIQLKEKEDIAKKLKQELTTAKAEHEKLNKEKEDKIRLCQNEYVQFKEKCNKLERQIEELNIRHEKERETTTYNEDTYNKLREENNRLRKERNLEKTKVLELTKEKEEMSRKLKQEVTAAKSENDKLKKENDNLVTDFKKESYRDTEKISKLRQEYEDLFAKYKTEIETRSRNDMENEKLRSESKAAKAELVHLKNENEELKQEVTAANAEHETLRSEKDDIIRLLRDESNKSKEKCNNLEREIVNLNIRYSSEEKMHQHNAYELMQLQNDIKICKHEKAQLEEALKDQKEVNVEIEKKFRDLELNRSKCKQCDKYEKTMAKLKTEKQELQDKCKSKDDLLQKADKENRHLKDGIDQLKSNIIGHKQEIETLNNRMEILREEKLEFETITRSRSPQATSETKQCQNCWKYKNDISGLKKEVNSLRDRLSEAAGNKLRDNNPNIADLSDMNRPTSLAEKFSTLYTDEYTDAMEVIETDTSEEECAGTMLQWLKICYDWCEQLAKEQRDMLTENSTGFMKKYLGHGENFVISARCLIHVKEFQKKIAVDSLIAVGKICHIKSLKEEKLINDNHISKYIKKCSELCWMMQITDPPLCLKFDVKHGENLDRNSYNVFTKSGSKVDFLVWPILYLHKTGPLLAKGVAQGM